MHGIIREDLEAILDASVEWDMLRGKSVLVTGANGFLPAYMIESILMLNTRHHFNCKITGGVRDAQKAFKRFSDYRDRGDLCFIELDVSKEINISSRFDYIIHAASPASPKLFGIDPVGTMLANLHGTNQLLMLAHEWRSEKFLFLSTGEVYGEVSPQQVPTSESDYGYIDILSVRSCYCESKRAAETLIVSYLKQYGVPSVIVRPFHTYGPGMNLDDGRVFADFVNSAVKGSDIILASDGSAVRAFCYLSTDMGTALLSGHQALSITPPQRLLTSQGLGEMGFGLPGAIGASFALDRGEVLCLNCDGGMMMNLQELQTIAHYRLPIKIIVFNNDGYLMIKHTQKAILGSRYSGTDRSSGVSCPDFSKLAVAFGFEAYQIRTWEDFDEKMPLVQSHQGPVICEVFMDPEQFFHPKVGVAVQKDGALLSPPLEDMSPFLRREELKQSLLVPMHEKSKLIQDQS